MADLTTFNPLFLALFANADGTGEISGNGYARLSITNDGTVFSVDGSGNRLSIVPLRTAVATGTGWGVIRSVGFYDLSTAGTRLAYVAVDPIAVAGTQALAFPAGGLGYTSGGSGAITPADRGLFNIPRSLYLYDNRGMQAQSVPGRSLYLYDDRGVEIQSVEARDLYLDENRGIEALTPLARDIYLYEQVRDGEVFPWLMRLNPSEQYRGGQVDLFGDGFGELVDIAAAATVTTSSVLGGNVGDNAKDRTEAAWISTSGINAWIRFSFGSPRLVSAITLSTLASGGDTWGLPQFRFSDGGANVEPGIQPAAASVALPEYPVGISRTHYILPTPRTTTYVEIRTLGYPGPLPPPITNPGLQEVWMWEDLDQTAEASSAILNKGLVSETAFGIAAWRNRSPGLWPANGGLPITAAATVTVPADAESGLVIVEEDA